MARLSLQGQLRMMGQTQRLSVELKNLQFQFIQKHHLHIRRLGQLYRENELEKLWKNTP